MTQLPRQSEPQLHHYTFGSTVLAVAIDFVESADRHETPRRDAEHALLHSVGRQEVEGRPSDTTFMFVGRPHPQSRRFLEVSAAMRPDGRIEILHVMWLSDLWAHLVPLREREQ